MNAQNEVAHSIGLYRCGNRLLLESGGEAQLESHVRMTCQLARDAGFTIFGCHAQRYSDKETDGYTLLIAIGQSAINLHTYPEKGTVTVWVITCPGEDDDGAVTKEFGESLKLYFRAESIGEEGRGFLPLDPPVA